MVPQKLLQQVIGVILVILLVGCEGIPLIATPTPLPTTIPAAGIGVPVSGGNWQITVGKVHMEPSLRSGVYPNETTFTPNEGFAFLVVDVDFNNLDASQPITITLSNVALVGADGEIHTADGGGWSETNMCAGCAMQITGKVGDPSLSGIMVTESAITFGTVGGGPISFVFVLKSDQLKQDWKLQFHDVPPIPFLVDQKAQHEFKTAIGTSQDVLPSTCQVKATESPGNDGRLIYQRWENNRVVLGAMIPDGSAEDSCTDIASGDIKYAINGNLLLEVGPLQGWPSLFLVEPDNKVTALAQNSPNIQAGFDPSGQYAIFMTQSLGQENQELYVYDQKTSSTTLIKKARWIGFRPLPNGRLLLTVPKTDSWESDAYIGQLGSKDFTLVTLPEDVGTEAITPDGEHLLYVTGEYSDQRLVLSRLDGSEEKVIVAGTNYGLEGYLSPNGKFVLFQAPEEDEGVRVGLFDLTTNQSMDIVSNDGEVSLGFSPDSQWAIVDSTTDEEQTGSDETVEKRTWHIISTADGKIAQTVEDAINVYFSPDGTRLAYTLLQADGALEMFVMTLADGNTKSLGVGILLGWEPAVSS